jgi:hypothetical protein
VRGVPLFWREIPETGEEEKGFEPDQSLRSALSLELSLDETSPVQFCNDVSLDIPVHAVLATDDGFAAEFSSIWRWSPFFESPPSGHLQLVPGLNTAGFSDRKSASCPTTVRFDSEGISGRFCDEGGRLALFPTACGGVVQVDSSEAPFPPLEAPVDHLAPFEGVTLIYEGLPPIAVSGTLDDPTACYDSHEAYWVTADLGFETDGVRLEANDLMAYSAPREVSDDTGQLLSTQSIAFTEYCGDVSESVVWTRMAGSTTGASLCLTLAYERLADGTRSYAAEATLRGAGSWLFLAQ